MPLNSPLRVRNEPLIRKKHFFALVDIIRKISNIDTENTATTSRAYEAEMIFRKLAVHAISFN